MITACSPPKPTLGFLMRGRSLLVFIAALAILIVAPWSFAARSGPLPAKTSRLASPHADTITFEQIGGPATQVAACGQFVCAVLGQSLKVLDVSGKRDPILVGETAAFTSTISNLAASASFAVLAADDGVHVVDIRIPRRPLQVSFLPISVADRVDVAGAFLFVAVSLPIRLLVVSIEDPTSPVVTGELLITQDRYDPITDVATANRNTVLVSRNEEIYVVDSTDKYNPRILSSIHSEIFWDKVEVIGHIAYAKTVAVGDTNNSNLKLVDIGSPSRPQILSEYSFCSGHDTGDIASDGRYVFLTSFCGLEIVDVAQPMTPTLESKLEHRARSADLALASGRLFTAERIDGLGEFDVSTPAQPVALGRYRELADARGIAVAGNYALVADGWQGLFVLDLSDPARTRVLPQQAITEPMNAIAIDGSFAYIGEPAAFKVLDLADPAHPSVIGQMRLGGSVNQMVISGTFAVLALDSGILEVIDVSEKAAPKLVGQLDLDTYPDATVSITALDVQGRDAYVSFITYGSDVTWNLVHVDLSNPGSPTPPETANLGVPYATLINLDYPYAYLGEGSGFTSVYLASHPWPSWAGQVILDHILQRQYITNGHAYLAGSCHYWEVDIAKPSDLRLTLSTAFPQYVRSNPSKACPSAEAIVARNGDGLITLGNWGVLRVGHELPAHPTPAPTIPPARPTAAPITATPAVPPSGSWPVLVPDLKNPRSITVSGRCLLVAEGGSGPAPNGQYQAGFGDSRVTVVTVDDPSSRQVWNQAFSNVVDPVGRVHGVAQVEANYGGCAPAFTFFMPVLVSGGQNHPPPAAQLTIGGFGPAGEFLGRTFDLLDIEMRNNPHHRNPANGGFTSNPWRMANLQNDQSGIVWLVADAGANDILVYQFGEIYLYATFPMLGVRADGSDIEPAPLGLAVDPAVAGRSYAGLSGSFEPGKAEVRRLPENVVIASGMTGISDLAYGPKGLFALETISPTATSYVTRIWPSGSWQRIAGGLTAASAMAFTPEGDLLVAEGSRAGSFATDRIVRIPAGVLDVPDPTKTWPVYLPRVVQRRRN